MPAWRAALDLEHLLPMFLGPGGNGKSTLLGVVVAVLGEYAATADPALLVDRGYDTHSIGVADLQGRRLTLVHETTLRESGRYEPARQLGEDTLTHLRRVLGDDHLYTLRSATVLAATLRELGQCERARQLGEDTLTRARRVLGDDHSYTLRSADSLDAVRASLGEQDRAR